MSLPVHHSNELSISQRQEQIDGSDGTAESVRADQTRVDESCFSVAGDCKYSHWRSGESGQVGSHVPHDRTTGAGWKRHPRLWIPLRINLVFRPDKDLVAADENLCRKLMRHAGGVDISIRWRRSEMVYLKVFSKRRLHEGMSL